MAQNELVFACVEVLETGLVCNFDIIELKDMKSLQELSKWMAKLKYLNNDQSSEIKNLTQKFNSTGIKQLIRISSFNQEQKIKTYVLFNLFQGEVIHPHSSNQPESHKQKTIKFLIKIKIMKRKGVKLRNLERSSPDQIKKKIFKNHIDLIYRKFSFFFIPPTAKVLHYHIFKDNRVSSQMNPITVFAFEQNWHYYNNKLKVIMESQQTGESYNQQPQQQIFMLRQLQRFTQLKSDQDQSREHLRRTLIIEMQNLMGQVAWLQDISIKIRESLELKAEEKLQLESQEPPKIGKIPQLILKQIVMISTTKQVHISSVSNKLKVFVSKTMQKQSSKLRYNYNSYITQVLQEVNDFGFNQQVQEMRVQLQQLRKKFKIIDVNVISMHKHHLDIKRPIENASFYISFYVERLLFFNDIPIKYNGKLLFVPMGIGKSLNRDTNKVTFIKISPNYIRELSRENAGWETYCLEIIFMNSTTSQVVYYSNISYQKKWHENQTSALLRKIRCFIYFSLIFNYLQNNLLSSACTTTSTSINLPLTPKYQVTINTQPQIKTTSGSLKSDHRITKEILGYFDQSKMKKRNETSRQEVTDNFVNYLRCVKVRMQKGQVGLGEGAGLRAKYVYVGDKRIPV